MALQVVQKYGIQWGDGQIIDVPIDLVHRATSNKVFLQLRASSYNIAKMVFPTEKLPKNVSLAKSSVLQDLKKLRNLALGLATEASAVDELFDQGEPKRSKANKVVKRSLDEFVTINYEDTDISVMSTKLANSDISIELVESSLTVVLEAMGKEKELLDGADKRSYVKTGNFAGRKSARSTEEESRTPSLSPRND